MNLKYDYINRLITLTNDYNKLFSLNSWLFLLTVKVASVQRLGAVSGDVLARDLAEGLIELELVDVGREILDEEASK